MLLCATACTQAHLTCLAVQLQHVGGFLQAAGISGRVLGLGYSDQLQHVTVHRCTFDLTAWPMCSSPDEALLDRMRAMPVDCEG